MTTSIEEKLKSIGVRTVELNNGNASASLDTNRSRSLDCEGETVRGAARGLAERLRELAAEIDVVAPANPIQLGDLAIDAAVAAIAAARISAWATEPERHQARRDAMRAAITAAIESAGCVLSRPWP